MTRDIRDRLAEALWRADGTRQEWSGVSSATRDFNKRRADWLLAALPSVGLTINTLPDEEGR